MIALFVDDVVALLEVDSKDSIEQVHKFKSLFVVFFSLTAYLVTNQPNCAGYWHLSLFVNNPAAN